MNSLAVRLFFSATVWIILTLLSAGLLLSDLNKQNNLEAFDDRLNLLVETLIGGSKVDSSDSITVVRVHVNSDEVKSRPVSSAMVFFLSFFLSFFLFF